MRSDNRFAYIDSARAIAAALVVWQHAAEQFSKIPTTISSRWFADLAEGVNLGRLGVVTFFCISGYVIPASFALDDASAGRRFVIRRFFRLYPAFWLSVVAGLAVLWAPHGWFMSPAWIAANLTMVPELLGAQPAIGLYWTLAYELGFYALCLGLWRLGVLGTAWLFPVLLLIAGAAAGAFLAIVIWGRLPWAGDATLSALNFSAMFLGASWRRRAGKGSPLARLAMLGGLIGLLGLLPALCGYLIILKGAASPYFRILPYAYSGGMALFLALTTFARLSWRPLAWVGLVSYSLYLFHPVVLYPLRDALQPLLQRTGFDLGAAIGLTLICSTGLAAVVFYALERPCIALGRRLSSRG